MARPNEPAAPPSAAAPREHRIGLVSDTHGHYLPALDEVLAGVEEILHAGGFARDRDPLRLAGFTRADCIEVGPQVAGQAVR